MQQLENKLSHFLTWKGEKYKIEEPETIKDGWIYVESKNGISEIPLCETEEYIKIKKLSLNETQGESKIYTKNQMRDYGLLLVFLGLALGISLSITISKLI